MATEPIPDVPPARLTLALVEEDVCPMCLGELDEGWECVDCGFDAVEYVEAGDCQ